MTCSGLGFMDQKSNMKELKEKVEYAIFNYMDSYDCPQVFTDQLRQTIAEDVIDIVHDKINDKED